MKLTVGVALLGCGTIGASVADALAHARDTIERRTGVGYELRGVAIRDPHKQRPAALERRLFTHDSRSIVEDPSVGLVVELIGVTTDAAELLERALDRGCHVVTANKDLLATQGPRLRALAASRGAELRFEAAVGGAIPIVRTLEEALAGDEILSIAGVLNGSCTSILSAMESGASFDEATALARRLGYAEADPTNDVDGHDAAHKLALLAQLAFGLAVVSPRIRRTGIGAITQRDVARARMLGLHVRLVAAMALHKRGLVAEVAPVLVPEEHEFARTAGAENVVQIVARDAGRLVLRGSGAGAAATRSAVMGDVVAVLRGLRHRRDPIARSHQLALDPAIDVEPFFANLARVAEVPHLQLWDDAVTTAPAAALANA
ncbi:MAG: homoserine dehydrogenase [Candidatus Cybelea sp.]